MIFMIKKFYSFSYVIPVIRNYLIGCSSFLFCKINSLTYGLPIKVFLNKNIILLLDDVLTHTHVQKYFPS